MPTSHTTLMPKPFRAIDPYTGRAVGVVYAPTDPKQLEETLERLLAAQRRWRRATVVQRVKFCKGAARLLRERAETLVGLATAEMGKLPSEAQAVVEKCATLCDYYAEHVPRLAQSRKVPIEGANAYVAHQPLGIVLAIMPWNFPYWQVIRCVIPAVAAGNVALLKHAPNVPACAVALDELFAELAEDTDSPPLLSNVRLDNAATEALIADQRIAGVSLTGSTAAGRKVGAAAGAALKPCVLELGGSDAYVVLADADVPAAVEACFAARRLNSGQSCISAKRLIVVEEVRDAFVEQLRARIASLSPLMTPDDEHQDALAPMAREDLRNALAKQVARSVEAGATLLLGGASHGPGWHYEATLLTDVRPGMPAFDEELFGPVFAVVTASDTEHALALAEDSDFGLGGAVFTSDLALGEDIARERLVSGAAFVNDFVRSDPRLPFGGVRDSGFGRELSDEGYYAFTNAKTVVVRHPR